MKDHIFRMYDIRGRVGTDFNIDCVYALVRSIVAYLLKINPNLTSVAVARDGRVHGGAIQDEVVRALKDSGIDVIDIGLCHTPIIYFAVFNKLADAGLMITASHNPACDNGLKICLGEKSIWGEQMQEIKELYKQGSSANTGRRGSYREQNISDLYLLWIENHFNHLKGIKSSFVIDCGNGATGAIIPKLVERMGWSNAILLYEDVDGTYPNHEADPTVLSNMEDLKNKIKLTDASFGVAFDGDGDRMGAMTSSGFLVPGDWLLSIFSQPLLKKQPGAAIVFDVKASDIIMNFVKGWSGIPVISPTGVSWIKKYMTDHKALLGGELSCHFFFNDRYFGYDDGIYSFMRLFEIIVESGKSLDQLCSIFPKTYGTIEIRIPCAEHEKSNIVMAVKESFSKRSDAQLILVDGVRAHFPYGWGVIRVSNTQPAISLRIESQDLLGLEKIKNDFYQVLQYHIDSIIVRQHLKM